MNENKIYTAEIIAVGTELLLGNTANTDAMYISQGLSELGINVYFHTVVGDNPVRLKSAVQIARERADIIITTGGLGPTYDDLTKQTLAECFGKKLIFFEDEAERIKNYFTKHLHSRSITENNMQQAMLPEGCTVFRNERGTAPGCAFESDGKHVIMLPGPPRECGSMFKNESIPYLKKLSACEILSHNIHIFGMGESAVEDKLRGLMVSLSNPTLAPYAKEGEVNLRLTAMAENSEQAESLMSPVLAEVCRILGDVIYGVDVDSLEGVVLDLLKSKGLTLATAESCTGGLLSKRLTDIPGASSVFSGGVIAYSNDVKTAILGVDADLIREKGAVSAEVAIAMAEGAANRLNADIAVGITGIAGPATNLSQKEPGIVFIALKTPEKTECRSFHLGLDRYRTRIMSAGYALDMIRRALS